LSLVTFFPHHAHKRTSKNKKIYIK